ncbi:hypothetical protein Emed_001437 [Eimeria media]
MAQPSLLRTAVPDRSARRLLCPALFTYTRLTRWPHSYRQLVRDRRLMERGVSKVNHMLRSIGGLEHQASYVMRTKHGCKLHVLETPRESPGPAEAKYTLGDVWRLRLLLLKQLNAIVKAATDNNTGDLDTSEAGRPRSPQADEERQQDDAAQNSDPNSSSPLSPSPSFPTTSLKASADRFILYLHGGAFISQSPEFYKIFLNDISRETGARVIAPCYPLAPESVWPSQLHHIFRVYRHLVEDDGIDPNKIVFVGDSAGGNLVVTLLMQIIKYNQTVKDASEALGLPRAAVLLSPWLDLSQSGPSYTLNQTAEPLLPVQSIRRAAALYLFGHPGFAQDAEEPMEEASAFRDPWVSPAFLSDPEVLRSFPPTCIHAGSVEVLLSDSLIFARRLNAAVSEAPFEEAVPLPPLPEPKDNNSSSSGSSRRSSSSGDSGMAKQSLPVASVFPNVQVDGTCDNDSAEAATTAAADAAASAAAAAKVAATAHADAAAAADALSGGSRQEEAEAAVEASGCAGATAAAAATQAAAAEVAAGEALAAKEAAAEAAVAEFEEPAVSSSASLGAMVSAQVLSFLSPESVETVSCDSGLNEGDSDKALPSFFSSTGWLSDSCLKTLQNAGTVDLPEAVDLSANKPNVKASVTVWKDEFHVFPCFGFMEEPFASDCTRRIAQWINAQFGETPDTAAEGAPPASTRSAPAAAAEAAPEAAPAAAPAAAAEAAPKEATGETPAATAATTPQAAETAAETAEVAATAAESAKAAADTAADAAAKTAETGLEAGTEAKEK